MGTQPGLGGTADWGRFVGYVVPVENALYPIDNVLHCKGRLYRAAFVRNNAPGGTPLADPELGQPDEAQVQVVLNACAVPVVAANIGGTGKALGTVFVDLANVLSPGPFTWAEQQSGLDYIEQLDAVCVPDDASGRYRTFETLNGEIFRIPLATTPAGTPDFTFTEGVDVLEARITRDPAGAANRVTVTGAPTPGEVAVDPVTAGVTLGAQCRFTAGTAFAPYLPPDLPVGPDGYAAVTQTFSSPLIEKGALSDPGDVIACEAVAQFLLSEYNCVVDTLEFSTPRDDRLGPGQTIHLHSPRLGITDPDQHYWLQSLEISVDEQGAFTQRLRCLRRS
jgi:hypothetical protein